MKETGVILSFVAFFVSIGFTVRPVQIYRRLWLSMATAPLLCSAFLLATSVLTFSDVVAALKGDDKLQPYTIVVLFQCLAYLGLSLDNTGVLQGLALAMLRRSNASYRNVFLLMFAVCSLLTILTSNDIVVLTLTPFICHLASKSGIDPKPLLFVQFLAANTWSVIFSISNPTNIIVAEANALSFLSYLKWMFLPAVVAGTTLLAALYLRYRRWFALDESVESPVELDAVQPERPPVTEDHENDEDPQTAENDEEAGDDPPVSEDPLPPQYALPVAPVVEDPPPGVVPTEEVDSSTSVIPNKYMAIVATALSCSCLFFLVIANVIHLKVWIICAIFGSLMFVADFCDDVYQSYPSVAFQRTGIVLRKLPWAIIPFVCGMFILVEAFSVTEFTQNAATTLAHATMGNVFLATFLILALSTVCCNLMNNQPMTIFFVSILTHPNFRQTLIDMVEMDQTNRVLRASMFSLVMGSNFGANLTFLGALAGILWRSMLGNTFNIEITLREFFMVGLLCMVPVMAFSGISLAGEIVIFA